MKRELNGGMGLTFSFMLSSDRRRGRAVVDPVFSVSSSSSVSTPSSSESAHKETYIGRDKFWVKIIPGRENYCERQTKG